MSDGPAPAGDTICGGLTASPAAQAPRKPWTARLRRAIRRHLAPGGRSWLARKLDEFACTRTLTAFVRRTEDVQHVRWAGRPIWQYPLDTWTIQEMICSLQPDLIVETGTYMGGSAFFYASICDLISHGRIITIDVAAKETISHPRIRYIQGSSTDPGIVGQVAAEAASTPDGRVLVILDSDHRARHVRQELEAYAPLVPVGSYIHVQDGCIDTLACFRGGRPGPLAAVKAFLADHPEFVRDTEVELRYVMTAHPYGWLRRV